MSVKVTHNGQGFMQVGNFYSSAYNRCRLKNWCWN